MELSTKLNGVSGRVRSGNSHEKNEKNTTLKRTPNPPNPGLSFVALIKMKAMLCVILMLAFNLIEQLQSQGVFFPFSSPRQ